MKPATIATFAAIAAAGIGVYFVVRKIQGANDTVSGIIDTVVDKARVIGKTIAAGPGAVLDESGDRVPVADQLKTSYGTGLILPAGNGISYTNRLIDTGGSMLLTDAERNFIRLADSGQSTVSTKAKSIYDLLSPSSLQVLDEFAADSYNPNSTAYMLNN